MKIVITTILAFVSITIGAVAYAPTPACATGTCFGAPPICAPGQRPICLCDEDYGATCRWVCG